jgi:hypothetical protein
VPRSWPERVWKYDDGGGVDEQPWIQSCCPLPFSRWLSGLIKTGWKKALELDDLPLLPEGDWADNVAPRFGKFYEQEMKKSDRSACFLDRDGS